MISVNITKAKEIAHETRRAARAEEFKPYDDVIAKQIPNADAQIAESARQAIREKYAAIQEAIDAAGSVAELKSAMPVYPTP
jgi:hypothetical protein